MDELSKTYHTSFEYAFIPYDINDEIEIRKFEGTEEKFTSSMRNHFNRDLLTDKNKESLKQSIKEKFSASENTTSKLQAAHNTDSDETVKQDSSAQAFNEKTPSTSEGEGTSSTTQNSFHINDIDPGQLNKLISHPGTYQIIPLYLPTKANNFIATNAYIDDLGRVKERPQNARASRICQNDIRGDCFISSTYDDDNLFKRVNFTKQNYTSLLENPPPTADRWDQNKLVQQLLNGKEQNNQSANTIKTQPKRAECANCGKKQKDSENGKSKSLLRCSRCHRTAYCSIECQKADWKYHKRVCITN